MLEVAFQLNGNQLEFCAMQKQILYIEFFHKNTEELKMDVVYIKCVVDPSTEHHIGAK